MVLVLIAIGIGKVTSFSTGKANDNVGKGFGQTSLQRLSDNHFHAENITQLVKVKVDCGEKEDICLPGTCCPDFECDGDFEEGFECVDCIKLGGVCKWRNICCGEYKDNNYCKYEDKDARTGICSKCAKEGDRCNPDDRNQECCPLGLPPHASQVDKAVGISCKKDSEGGTCKKCRLPYESCDPEKIDHECCDFYGRNYSCDEGICILDLSG